jgi:hypothetical protein
VADRRKLTIVIWQRQGTDPVMLGMAERRAQSVGNGATAGHSSGAG